MDQFVNPQQPEQPVEPVAYAPAQPVQEAFDAPEQQPAAPARSNKKLLIAILAAASAVILLLVLILSLSGGGNFTHVKHSVRVVDLNDSEYLVIFDGEKGAVLDASVDYEVSPVGNALAYLDEDGSLYYLEAGEDAIKVASDADVVQFSSDGKYLLYTCAQDEGDSRDLFLVKAGDTDAVRIATGIQNGIFSPDAQTFYYQDDDKHYLWQDGEVTEVSVGKDYRILSISNDADYVYSVKIEDEKSTLYVQEGFDGDRLKLAKSGAFSSGRFVMNADGSELLFQLDEAIYLSRNGEEAEKLIGSSLRSFILPDTALYTDALSRSIMVKTFVGTQLIAGNGLYTLGETGEDTVKLASSVDEVMLAQDGKSILYSKEDKLYRIDDVWDGNSAERIAENIDIDSFYASADLSVVYLLSDDDDLYYLDGDEAERIKGGNDIQTVKLSGNGKTCFVKRDGEWWFSNKGDDLEKIEGVDTEDVTLYVDLTHAVIVTDEAIYVSNGDEDFEKLADKG